MIYLCEGSVAKRSDTFLVWLFSFQLILCGKQASGIQKLKYIKSFTPRPSYGEMICHSKFCICEKNPMVLPFKWFLFGRTFTQCYLFLGISLKKYLESLWVFPFPLLVLLGVKCCQLRFVDPPLCKCRSDWTLIPQKIMQLVSQWCCVQGWNTPKKWFYQLSRHW